MPRRPLVLRVVFVAALVFAVVLAAPALADMDAALDLTDEGDEARKAKKFPAAIKLYERALEEAPDCLPARYGLGEALLATGKRQDAVVAFRQVLRGARAATGLPGKWKDLVPGAKDRLEEHDEHGRELDTIIDAHVARVMKVASKFVKKDPDLAQRALNVVLTLRPNHKRASALLSKMAGAGARKEAIFDGKQIADWDGGRGQWWSVKDGVIVSETEGVATFIRNQKEITGNFDVIMEARIAKVYDKAPFIALMAAWKAEFDHTRFGTLSGALTWYEKMGEDVSERVFREEAARVKPAYDPAEWTRYELRFRDEWIYAVINELEVHKILRTKKRAGGYVGILSQGCRGEIKQLYVLHR